MSAFIKSSRSSYEISAKMTVSFRPEAAAYLSKIIRAVSTKPIRELANKILAQAAIISTTGGEIDFDAEKGAICGRLPATTQSLIRGRIELGRLNKE